MRPCIRCYAAIGNADDPCPECGALQVRATAESPLPDSPEDGHTHEDEAWLLAAPGLLGFAILLLSVLAFGGSGLFVALGCAVVLSVAWNVLTAGAF